MSLAALAHSQAFRLTHLSQIGSTNDAALQSAHAGDPGRHWFVADEQLNGKGRMGRQWSSPPGNLYASLVLIDLPLAKAPELGFVAGVALHHALRDVLGQDPQLQIKWPNDILYRGAKLAGILLESTQLTDGVFAIVLGIGVNCASHPATALYPAIDLSEIGTLLSHRDDIFLRLSEQVAIWLDMWDQGRNFEAIRAEWLHSAAGVGAKISVSTSATTKQDGIFETIDMQGRLILKVAGETRVIHAGDVFLSAHPSVLLDSSAVFERVSHEDRP